MNSSQSYLFAIAASSLITLFAIPHSSLAMPCAPVDTIPVGTQEVKTSQFHQGGLITSVIVAKQEKSQLPSELEMQKLCFSSLIRSELAQGGYNEFELKSFLRAPLSLQMIETGCKGANDCGHPTIHFRIYSKNDGKVLDGNAVTSSFMQSYQVSAEESYHIRKYSCALSHVRFKDQNGAQFDGITFSLDKLYHSAQQDQPPYVNNFFEWLER